MPAVVNTYSSQAFTDSLPVTITAVGSGNALMAVSIEYDNRTPYSITTTGNTWVEVRRDRTIFDDGDIVHYRCVNITNAPTTVTFALTGAAGSITYWLYELSGVDNTTPVGQTPARATGDSTTPSVSFTTGTANEAAIGVVMLANGTTFTADTGYTELQPYADDVYETSFYDADVGAAGAKTGGGTLGASRQWAATLVSYRAAGGTSHATTGTLSSQASTVSGSATHLTLHTTTGALASQAATVAGSATHLTLHTTSGALASAAATVAGSATHLTLHTTTGALLADAATMTGVAVGPSLFTQAELDFLLAYMEANLAIPTAAEIAAAILAAAQTTPITANIAQVNSLPVDGSGTEGDPWGPA